MYNLIKSNCSLGMKVCQPQKYNLRLLESGRVTKVGLYGDLFITASWLYVWHDEWVVDCIVMFCGGKF